MDESTLHILDNLIAVLGEMKEKVLGQNEQYERDCLRSAQEHLRSCKSRLQPKVKALLEARLREGRD